MNADGTQPGKYYVYAVIDKAQSPATLLAIRLSRQSANEAKLEHEDAMTASELRVRRAKLTLFEK